MKHVKGKAVLIAAAIMLCAEALPAYAEKSETSTERIDYSDRKNWAFWNSGEDKEADLFIICPVVDMGKDGNFNADITDEKTKSKFVGALNMELGIYTDTASVYSPYYRQVTFPVYSLGKDEREQYMQIAYNDVRDAFLYYCDNCDESRPLILAGFSQGSDMLIRLMTEFFDDEKYSCRLAAAYAIGWSLSEEQTAEYPWLKPAQGESDTGVIVMFNSEAEHITSSLMVGENEHTCAINPLNWKTDGTPADKSLNKGACFTDYDGNITSEVPELTGAYIDEKRGTLKVTDINESDYPAAIFDEGIFHIYDYQFFYRNLQDNVAARTAAFLDARNKELYEEEEEESAVYSISLEAEADCSECFVDDEFTVTITATNTGNEKLENVTVYLEDAPIYTAETLDAKQYIQLRIKLKTQESDIESGGVINISAAADELEEPVRTSVAVTVKPVETNPATGADDTGIMIVLACLFASVAMISHKKAYN